MPRLQSGLFALTAALLLSACGPTETPTEIASDTTTMPANRILIKGQLAYRERIRLTPGHSLKVTLSDVSVADRAAPVIASVSRELDGEQVPLAFELPIERDELQSRHRYSVRGTLRDSAGDLVWTTDTAHLIDTTQTEQDLGTLRLVRADGSGGVSLTMDNRTNYICGETSVTTSLSGEDLRLKVDGKTYNLPRVYSASGEKYETGAITFWSKGKEAMLEIDGTNYPTCKVMDVKTDKRPGGLAGTSWQVEDVANGGIIDNANLTLDFGEDGRLSGSSGCNRFSTSYEAGAEKSLSLTAIAGTRKACVPALMNLEQEFLDILGTVKSYDFPATGGLVLISEDGRAIQATSIPK